MNYENNVFVATIRDQTQRSIWSLKNVIQCIPEELWNKKYCDMPLWKHIYHTLHSFDKSYINPNRYEEPPFHKDGLDNLDIKSKESLSRELLNNYLIEIESKVNSYLNALNDKELLSNPPDCSHSKFRLILGQHRHLDMHIGMIMGYLITENGLWPRIITPHEPFPGGNYGKYF